MMVAPANELSLDKRWQSQLTSLELERTIENKQQKRLHYQASRQNRVTSSFLWGGPWASASDLGHCGVCMSF
jgi:hypothetical protein